MDWIQAHDLSRWANERVAQEELPRVIRRLIHATLDEGLRRVEFHAGASVQTGGWDGIVESDQGNAFVPAGVSAWELGTNKDIRKKADSDYEKRTADPLGLDRSQTTFVFITPRTWPRGKERWADNKKEDGIWADVRAYDANDLEAWLEQAPAEAAWLAAKIGTRPPGIRALDECWSAFATTTKPALSLQLVLSDRSDELKRIHDWLKAPPSVLEVQGESIDEALAFVSASLGEMAEDERSRWQARRPG